MQSYIYYTMRQCIVVFSTRSTAETERRTENTRRMHSITIKNRHSHTHTRILAPTHTRLHTGRGGGRYVHLSTTQNEIRGLL